MDDEVQSDELRCANCGREPRNDENPDDEWRAASNGVGELHVLGRWPIRVACGSAGSFRTSFVVTY